ncbi:MAG: ArnT family glycosyltransferase [Alphaproteobacteria bacterium]
MASQFLGSRPAENWQRVRRWLVEWPVFSLLPVLFLCAVVVLLLAVDALEGDEGRYVDYARNMLQGFYTPVDAVNLISGPGYPVILMPLVLLKLPIMAFALLNAVILYLAALVLFYTLRYLVPAGSALVAALVFGMYPQFLVRTVLINTETITLLVICCMAYFLTRFHMEACARWLDLALAAFFLGWLALIKIFFGYVITAGILFYGGLYLIRRFRTDRIHLAMFAGALLLCTPWLIYTHSLTGKVFYWGDSGGGNLYWMTIPHAGELGSWQAPRDVAASPALTKNHGEFYDSLAGLSGAARSDRFFEGARAFLQADPSGFVRNWAANVGRLTVNYPYTEKPQTLRGFLYIIPNMFLYSLAVLLVIPVVRLWRRVPAPLWPLLFFGAVSAGGSSLVAANARHFDPVLVILAIWIPVAAARLVDVRIRDRGGPTEMLS